MTPAGPPSLDEALALVLANARALPHEPVPLATATGRTLALTVRTHAPLPAFDHAAMDGVALRSADAAGASEAAPVALRVVGTAYAGEPCDHAVGPGEAARIMTGAPLPEGADSVVEVERVAGDADRCIRISFPPQPFRNVRRAGEELPAGAAALPAGTRIGAAEAGLLASLDVAAPPCARRPRVAILSSGREVVPPGDPPGPHGIRDANGPALLAACLEAGAEPIPLGIAPDDPASLAAALRRALAHGPPLDALLLSGGAARTGARDGAHEALLSIGARPLFREVALKPGKAVGAYVLEGPGDAAPRLAFALPGNPAAALTGFWALVRPALLALQGRPETRLPEIRVPLPWAHEERPGRTHLLRVRLAPAAAPGTGLVVAERLPEGAAMLSPLARANALLRLEGTIRAGEPVCAMLLPGVLFSHA